MKNYLFLLTFLIFLFPKLSFCKEDLYEELNLKIDRKAKVNKVKKHPTSSNYEDHVPTNVHDLFPFHKTHQKLNKHKRHFDSKDSIVKKYNIEKKIFSYGNVKKNIQDTFNVEYNVDLGVLPQRASPSGKGTSIQYYIYPSLNWNIFNHDNIGSGSFQISYKSIRYGSTTAKILGERIFIASGINSYTYQDNVFSQFTYTHVFSGNKLSLVLGQYSLYDIDGTTYNNSSSSGFISYSLSKNGSATYSSGSLGAYFQLNFLSNFYVQFGIQDSYNTSGGNLNWSNLKKSKYSPYSFLYWTPSFTKDLPSQFSLLLYKTKAVPQQNFDTNGWSLNGFYPINPNFSLFGRINGSTGDTVPIKQSYTIGGVLLNPLYRHPKDFIGVSLGFNRMSLRHLSSISPGKNRKMENVLELLYYYQVSPYISITPDIQLFMNPSIKYKRHLSESYSIRCALTL